MRTLYAFLLLAACHTDPGDRVLLIAPTADADVVRAWAASIHDERIEVLASEDPAKQAKRERGFVVALNEDSSLPADTDRIERIESAFVVHAADMAARLSGTSRVLEAYGWRFHHPERSFLPTELTEPQSLTELLTTHTPDVARRGLHLHTLHPIEATYELWDPTADLQHAVDILDWVVRNHGNYVQWVGLEDIRLDPNLGASWSTHTAAIVAAAHDRGIEVGLGVQLFGSGNLQLALDLLDEVGTIDEQRAAMAPTLDLITTGIPWDVISLSFGEFFDEEPERFIASLELTYDEIHKRLPAAEVATTIHVGNDLEVTYQGETFLYYFLGAKADRPIVPWIHTVMYYNLFEDAGGAYHHDTFDAHRDYLLGAIGRQEPVGYHPESQYWIAFDSPVPQMYPLYIRSRWHDLDQIAKVGRLPEHVLFSSGWEWNAWLFDTTTLRENDHLDADPCDAIRWTYAPHGADGAAVADALCALADAQHTSLLEQRLTPYIASFDLIMELGYGIGKVSQPVRVAFGELVTLTGDALELYRADVNNLSAYADAIKTLSAPVVGLERVDPWIAEAQDGLQIDALRADFAHLLARAALAKADGLEDATDLPDAEAVLAQARVVIERRHAALWSHLGDRLTQRGENPTLYKFGYLTRADELCFWQRELTMAHNAIDGTTLSVLPCGL